MCFIAGLSSDNKHIALSGNKTLCYRGRRRWWGPRSFGVACGVHMLWKPDKCHLVRLYVYSDTSRISSIFLSGPLRIFLFVALLRLCGEFYSHKTTSLRRFPQLRTLGINQRKRYLFGVCFVWFPQGFPRISMSDRALTLPDTRTKIRN